MNCTSGRGFGPLAALTFMLVSAGYLRAGSTAAEPITAFRNATIIDGTGKEPRLNMTILVVGRKITGIFPTDSRPVPPDARIVDLTDKFVMPGLIDAHVHLGSRARDSGVMESILRSVFMHGVTTV